MTSQKELRSFCFANTVNKFLRMLCLRSQEEMDEAMEITLSTASPRSSDSLSSHGESLTELVYTTTHVQGKKSHAYDLPEQQILLFTASSSSFFVPLSTHTHSVHAQIAHSLRICNYFKGIEVARAKPLHSFVASYLHFRIALGIGFRLVHSIDG